MSKNRAILIAILTCFSLISFKEKLCAVEKSCEEAFTRVYDTLAWGVGEDGDPSSGFGSHIEFAKPYMEFLEKFLYDNQIQSVLDLGCGTWEFSRYINWGNVDYLGMDTVKNVVEMNQKKFGGPNIHFIHGDILLSEFPEADLMLCKDVLQHLKNADIQLFLQKIKKFKHCLITNDIAISKTDSVDFAKENRDIVKRVDNRPIDLTKPPFNVKGSKVFTYPVKDHVKQILYIRNE